MLECEDWKQLCDREKETFKVVVNELLTHTFILENQYNVYKRAMEVNQSYRFIDQNPKLFKEYLMMGGWDLINDFNDGVYYIQSDLHSNKERLDKLSTILFLVLRLIYEEKITSVSVKKNISVTVGDLFTKIDELGLGVKNETRDRFIKGLKKLKKYMLIDKASGDFTDNETNIIIYSSIKHMLNNSVLEAILTEFKSMGEGKSNIDNEGHDFEEEAVD